MFQSSHPLDVSGWILLLHNIVPYPSNDAFREWRETPHLSTPIFSRAQHAMLYWKKATSQPFALMAQAWVGIIQWPSFKPTFKLKVHCQWPWHQSRMGGMSLIKIEQRNFIGPRQLTCGSISSISLQRRRREHASTCRWTLTPTSPIIFMIKIFFRSGTSQMILMVISLWHRRILHPRGLGPNLLGLRCQFLGDWSQPIANLTSESDFHWQAGRCNLFYHLFFQSHYGHESCISRYTSSYKSIMLFSGRVSIISAPDCLLIPLSLQEMATLKAGDGVHSYISTNTVLWPVHLEAKTSVFCGAVAL